MTAGKLAAVTPAATTNTLLYRAPITSAASAILSVVNTTGTNETYRVGLRDYDQIFTLDSDAYKYRPGNVISTYIVGLEPGVTKSSLIVNSTNALISNNGSFKYLDLFIDSSNIDVEVKTATIGTIQYTPTLGGGVFAVGDLLTGQYGLTSTIYSINAATNTLSASLNNLTLASSTVYIASLTDVLPGDFLSIPDIGLGVTTSEIVLVGTINSGTHIANITRAQAGTSASEHYAGSSCRILRNSTTTTTITAALDAVATTVDVTSATGLTIGGSLKIGGEYMMIQSIDALAVTVERGSYGSTATVHTSGATVTFATDNGRLIINYFDSAETITNGLDTGTLTTYTTTNNPFNPGSTFVFDTNSDGIYEVLTNFNFNIDRTYRFLQSDSSNLDHDIRFVVTGSALAYTVGVTTNGVAGNSGAYVQIAISSATSPNLSLVDLDESAYSISTAIEDDPIYKQIYVYDVDGTLAESESFSTGTGSNTIDYVYPGPYGYIHDYTSTQLKVSLGLNSSAFSTYTKTAVSGVSGQKTITLNNVTSLIPGMEVSGTGIATGTRVSSITGSVVTLDISNTATVTGSILFEYIFYDSPRETGSSRSYVKYVSSTASTYINNEDYLYYDNALVSTNTDKNSGIIVGPGQSLVVYSSAVGLNFIINGFLDSTLDFPVNSYNRV